jgi:monoterpene epsilon-lactone hydrolase
VAAAQSVGGELAARIMRLWAPVVAVATAQTYLDGRPIDDLLVSPLRGDLAGLPPILVQCGEGDREADALAERLRDAGVHARLEHYPRKHTCSHVFWSFLPEGVEDLANAGEFIRSSLAAEEAAIRESP